MNIWYEYRKAWAVRWWLPVLAAVAVIAVVIGIVATFAGGPLALLFIPGLAVLYLHHLLAKRIADA